MLVMVSAGDLIALYMGLELQSLAIYVIAAIHRDHVKSTEAGLKYFVLGALSSGMLLYGASLVYGFTGQIEFRAIAEAVAQDGARSLGLIVGLVFVLAGLAFKISAVPFHMWTPDVYEGAPTPVTALLAGAPKVAAVALLTRFTVQSFGPMTPDWQQVVVFLSIASMLFGSFAAIGQRNIKRLMAYSSIGHMGYVLVGLAAGTEAGVQGVLIYMATYITMTLGTFALILSMRRRDGMVEDVYELAGLSRTNPIMALAMTVLMLSLAGLPPLLGFWGKYYVFIAAVGAGLIPLAVIGVVASTIGLFYYLRVVKVMWFDEPVAGFEPMAMELKLVAGAATLFIFPPISRSPVRSSGRRLPRPTRSSDRGMARRPAGTRRHLPLDEVGSTNVVALEAARAGDPGRLWITAARQTAGRGRRGRSWLSEPGNLYATLLLIDPSDDQHIVDLPLVVALGVRNGLASLPGLDPGSSASSGRTISSSAGRRRWASCWKASAGPMVAVPSRSAAASMSR